MMGLSAHAPTAAAILPQLLLLLLLLSSASCGDDVSHRLLPAAAAAGVPRLRSDATSQETVFPYDFEKVAIAAQNTQRVELGKPYTIRKVEVEGVDRRLNLQQDEGQLNSLARDDTALPSPHHNQRPAVGSSLWASRPLTNTEVNFVGILAAILVKLVLSTALATWFLAAGQALYGVASLTGTTAVFGMDSTIGYIYKTLPYIEALLRGETTFHH